MGLGFEARKEGRKEEEEEGEKKGGGASREQEKEREAVKLRKIWLFYARLLC